MTVKGTVSAMAFRFVHAADLHLDTPFARIGAVPPELREAVRDASLAAFDGLVDLAIARQAAFVVLAGHSYDGIACGLRAQLRLRAGLERLVAQGIRAVIALAGDERPSDWSAVPGWPDGVRVLGGGVRSVPIERDGERLATLHGGSGGDDPLQGFRREPAGGLHVGVLHCPPGGRLCVVDALAARGMDYWALGGAHGRRVLSAAPWIAFAGTPQGRGFQEAELGPKGALVLSVDGRALQPPEFVPLDRVRLLRLEADVSDVPDLAALSAGLIERAEAARLEHRGRVLLLRATLTGTGPLHGELLRPRALDDLLRELRGSARAAGEPVWWDAVEDRTRSARDPAELARRGDLTAELIGLSRELAADPARLRAMADERFAPLRRAIPGNAMALDEAALAELLDDATALAIDLMEEMDRP
ncbi:MAG TPA: DNA repair exonuclease [Thermomicrobiaceae bacterium]|nr:DNA repair exonuclease [Thermomicrobiaceae bacterium]